MILLAIILPIVIYFFLVKYLFNKFYKGTNQKLRRVIFIGLITLPFWDHIVGYGIYKTLCLTNGGITIYKTVTDEQEQRDYWLRSFQGQKRTTNEYGVIGFYTITKDLKKFKTVYINKCKAYKKRKYDRWEKPACTMANEYIKRKNIDIYSYKIKNTPRSKANSDFVRHSSLEVIRVIDEKNKQVESGYLNYCNPKYNNLPKTDKNYKSSCTNTDAIIKQYDLKNVIKVPGSPYESDHSGYKYTNFIWFVIGKGKGLMKNINTGETLYKSVNYKYRAGKYRGGWYLRYYTKPYLGIGGSESSCNNNLNIEDIIPNPYKNNN